MILLNEIPVKEGVSLFEKLWDLAPVIGVMGLWLGYEIYTRRELKKEYAAERLAMISILDKKDEKNEALRKELTGIQITNIEVLKALKESIDKNDSKGDLKELVKLIDSRTRLIMRKLKVDEVEII